MKIIHIQCHSKNVLETQNVENEIIDLRISVRKENFLIGHYIPNSISST